VPGRLRTIGSVLWRTVSLFRAHNINGLAAYVSKATVAATIAAFLVLIWSATWLIGDVRGSLNTIWGAEGRGGGGFKGFIVGKAIDMVAVLILAGRLLAT
jgi:uncharacterized BrkB/YihY/UPF0761 family membrane protein